MHEQNFEVNKIEAPKPRFEAPNERDYAEAFALMLEIISKEDRAKSKVQWKKKLVKTIGIIGATSLAVAGCGTLIKQSIPKIGVPKLHLSEPPVVTAKVTERVSEVGVIPALFTMQTEGSFYLDLRQSIDRIGPINCDQQIKGHFKTQGTLVANEANIEFRTNVVDENGKLVTEAIVKGLESVNGNVDYQNPTYSARGRGICSFAEGEKFMKLKDRIADTAAESLNECSVNELAQNTEALKQIESDAKRVINARPGTEGAEIVVSFDLGQKVADGQLTERLIKIAKENSKKTKIKSFEVGQCKISVARLDQKKGDL